MAVFQFTRTDENGDEIEETLPGKYEVCSRCQGEGKHCNPNIDGNGITSSEWAEWDEDERETYLSGGYDVTCHECHGKRVTLEIDRDLIETHGTAEQKELLDIFDEQAHENAAYEQMCRMERMMGA